MFGRRGIEEAQSNPAEASVEKAVVVSANVSSVPQTEAAAKAKSDALLVSPTEESTTGKREAATKDEMSQTKDRIYNLLMSQIDVTASSKLPRDELKRQIIDLIGDIVLAEKLPVNSTEQQDLATQIVDDMLGYGPLDPLLRETPQLVEKMEAGSFSPSRTRLSPKPPPATTKPVGGV